MFTGLFHASRAGHSPRPLTRLLLAFAFIAMGFALAALAPSRASAQDPGPVVRVINLHADIDRVSTRYLKGAIQSGNSDHVELIVIRLDTPGGSLDSTRDMVAAILESEVPVAVFVGPGGAQAASAGTFISAASGLLAMAPATNIGAAAVVDISGADLPSTLDKKVTEDTAAFIRSIAVERGRNADALELTVRDAKAYSATEAVEAGIADLIARDLADLLSQVDGRAIPAYSGDITVHTAGARVQQREMSWLDRALNFLANPNIAYIFISIGTVAVIIELWSPGLGVPGTLGAGLLALGFVGVGFLDFSWAGIAFIVLGIVLLGLEAQAPGVGYFGIAGVVSLVIGGIFLAGRFTDPDLEGGTKTVSIWLLAVVGGATLGFVLWLAYQIRQSARAPDYVSESSTHALVGQEGVVSVTLAPKGEVHVAGEFWSAELASGGRLEKGSTVKVVRVDGVYVIVEPATSGVGRALPGSV
jgi:membrane-bound serine protease (ClpP class)